MEKDEFLNIQRSAGRLDSEGVFTIDERHALAKLASFQLPKVTTWALKLVQAAISAGAPRIEVRQGAAATVFEFETAQEFQSAELISALVSPAAPPDQALAHLAVGLRAVGMGQKRPFTLTHFCRQDSFSVVFDGNRVALQEEPERTWTPSLTIAVRNPVFNSVTRRAMAEEAIELARSAHCCPVPLTLDGVRLDRYRLPRNPPVLLALGCESELGESFPFMPKPDSLVERLSDRLPTDRYSDLRPFCTFLPEEGEVQAIWRVQHHPQGIYDTPSYAFWVVDGVVTVCQPLPYIVDDSISLHLFLSGVEQSTDLSGFKFAGADRERRQMLVALLRRLLPRLKVIGDRLRSRLTLPSPKEVGLGTLATVLTLGVGAGFVLGGAFRVLGQRRRQMEHSAECLELFVARLEEALPSE